MSPFNHQLGICGADVTVPDETHHAAATAVAMCILLALRCIEATLKRPGGPQEEILLTSFKGKAPPWGMAVWPASSGNLLHLVPREGLSLAASPGVSRLELNRVHPPELLGWQRIGPWGP